MPYHSFSDPVEDAGLSHRENYSVHDITAGIYKGWVMLVACPPPPLGRQILDLHCKLPVTYRGPMSNLVRTDGRTMHGMRVTTLHVTKALPATWFLILNDLFFHFKIRSPVLLFVLICSHDIAQARRCGARRLARGLFISSCIRTPKTVLHMCLLACWLFACRLTATTSFLACRKCGDLLDTRRWPAGSGPPSSPADIACKLRSMNEHHIKRTPKALQSAMSTCSVRARGFRNVTLALTTLHFSPDDPSRGRPAVLHITLCTRMGKIHHLGN